MGLQAPAPASPQTVSASKGQRSHSSPDGSHDENAETPTCQVFALTRHARIDNRVCRLKLTKILVEIPHRVIVSVYCSCLP